MGERLTKKQTLVLGYLHADEGGATCGEIGYALHGRVFAGIREWAGPALKALERKGLAHRFGKARGDGGTSAIWHATRPSEKEEAK